MLMHGEDLHGAQTLEQPVTAEEPADGGEAQPVEPAPPITSRFLFVNVAGMRAKQLRRGAFPRLEAEDFEKLGSSKAERVAMAEVRKGLVHWEMPEWQRPVDVKIEPPRTRRGR